MSAVAAGLIAAERSQVAFRELSNFGEEARRRINEAGRALLEYGALSATRSFNAGIRVPGEDKFVLGGFTAPGETFAPAAVVGFDGTYYEGKFKKNHLELLDVYATIFRERPQVNAAIHTHSPYIEGFAFAHRELPVIFGDELARRTRDPIPLVPWEPRYSGGTIRNAVRTAPDAPAVIIANHGLFAWGAAIEDVVDLILALEDTAQVVTKAQLARAGDPLPQRLNW
jgi:L-ribulose-5-phosphate 4-epimerase